MSLPGLGNFGYIKLNNISKIYSELLKNIQLGTSLSTHNKRNASASNENNNIGTLLDMYNKGDLLRCKVLSYTDKKLYLTIEPDQVNGNLSFKNFEEEMVKEFIFLIYSSILYCKVELRSHKTTQITE